MKTRILNGRVLLVVFLLGILQVQIKGIEHRGHRDCDGSAQNTIAPKPSKETVLKVASFNTGHFNMGNLGGYQGDDVIGTLSLWRDWIRKQKCDILLVQEWNLFFDKDSVYTAQKELLEPFYRNIVWGDLNEWIYNGICTNLPIQGKQVKKLSSQYYAVVTNANIAGKQVALVSVHLNWNVNYHTLDLTQFIEFLKGFEYFIAGGDMNASQAGQLLFKAAGFNIANGGDYGFISTSPGGTSKVSDRCCLDNIITSANIEIRHPYSSITNVNDQDHLPILAEVVIK